MAFLRSLCLALVTLTSGVQGGGVSSKLQVHIPKGLTKADGYEHREALFGVPPYGASLQQNLYYADSDLCDPNVDTRGGYPIRPKGKDGKMAPWPSPYILMVDRGGCTFVSKVRNAQRSGAAGVIIADNTCLCSAGSECHSDPGADCETREPIMADDGSGSDISIPSFLMFKEDADPVKAELLANHVVRIEMAWSLPNPDDRVEYDLWTTPTDAVSRDFLASFKEAAIALDKHAYFTPHNYIYDGVKSGCQGPDGENQCYNLCTNNGRYCATDPDNDLDRGVSGADVVRESLRRTCIWNLYGQSNGIGVQWWEYVEEFMGRCGETYFNNEDCINDAMLHAGVDGEMVEGCMNDSGGLDKDSTNIVLEEALASREATGVVILPAIYVNSAALRGALEFETMFKAICAGFRTGSEPSVCKQCANCQDERACVADGHCPGGGGGISIRLYAGSLLAVVLVFGCVGLIQYQRSQRQMREQVRGILAEYMPLDENNKAEAVGIPEEDGEFT